MKTGKLRHIISLVTNPVTPDGEGGYMVDTTIVSEPVQRFANVRQLSMSETLESGQETGESNYEITIRRWIDEKIGRGTQILWNGKMLNISSVVSDEYNFKIIAADRDLVETDVNSNVNPEPIESVFRITVPEGGAYVVIYWAYPSYFPDYVGSEWNDDFGAYLQSKTPNTYNWGDGIIDINDWYQDGDKGISHYYADAGVYDIIISGKEVFIMNLYGLSFEIDTLPAALQFLVCSGNQLTSLPDVLPAALQMLDCYNNQLTSLPDVLPAALQILDCGRNQLNSNAVDNALTNLIAASLSDLQYVDLVMNPSAPPTPSIKAAFIAAYPTVFLLTD